MELFENYFFRHNILPILLRDVVVIPQVSNKDASLATLGEDFGGPEVLLMENPVALWISLGIEDKLVVVSWLDCTLITVVEIVQHQTRRPLWLVENVLLLVLTMLSPIPILWMPAKIPWKALVVNYVLWLKFHVGVICRAWVFSGVILCR